MVGLHGGAGSPWLGGRRDPENRDNWLWSDGTAWDYTNWAAGTPNDAGGVEDCARMYEDNDLGQWNDRVCNDKRTFVCKKGKNPGHSHEVLIYIVLFRPD